MEAVAKKWLILVVVAVIILVLSFIGAKDFFLGLFIAVMGYIVVWQSEWILINAGRIGFAEKFFRTFGGSRVFYKIIGTLIIVWGFLKAVGLSDDVLKWIVQIFFRIDVGGQT